jgi:hypothetical protein
MVALDVGGLVVVVFVFAMMVVVVLSCFVSG